MCPLMESPTKARSRINQPCAACRMLRRRCARNCILAPHFPQHEPEKFVGVHKVFGASNVVKMLQMVEEGKKEDAVESLVYEASARLRDPIYGSTGTILYMQKVVQDLEMQLKSMKAQVLEAQEQRDHLLRVLMDVHHLNPISPVDDLMFDSENFLLDDNVIGYDPIDFPIDFQQII